MKNRLRLLRESKHLSQSDMAKILNMSQGNYSRIESSNQPIEIEYALILSKYFSVSLDYLLENENENQTITFTIDEIKAIKTAIEILSKKII